MSVAGTDIKSHPDERHAGAQKVYFACFTDRGDTSMDDIREALPVHKEWILEQEAAGKVFLAGPLLAPDFTYAGSGLLVFRVETADEARLLAEQDPMHANGLRSFRIVPWQINEGSFRLDLTLSEQKFDFS